MLEAFLDCGAVAGSGFEGCLDQGAINLEEALMMA